MPAAQKRKHQPRLHRPAATAALLISSALLLAACGAGVAVKIGADLGEDIANGIGCAFRNCKESSTIELENVSPRFTVTQSNGIVHVNAWLSQSANLLTTLMLSPGDSLSANNGGANRPLSDTDGNRMDWATDFADASAQPRVTINFHRGSNVYPNVVTMPKPLSLVSPLGPLSVVRSAGQFDVRLASGDPLPNLALTADGSCTRADRSGFEVKALRVTARVDDRDSYLFHVLTADLDQVLTQTSLSANQNLPQTSTLASCSLVLSWTISVEGTVSASLSRHGQINAKRAVTMNLAYDSRL